MLSSFPDNELPLADLLRYAADQSVTAAIDLRSDLTVGRIDIVRGQIVDAVFGGLTCEEAVYAAMCSPTLRVNRGRAPASRTIHRTQLSTKQILDEGLKRRGRAEFSSAGARESVRPTRAAGGQRKPTRWRFLRLSLFGSGLLATSLVLTAAIPHRSVTVGATAPVAGRNLRVAPPRLPVELAPIHAPIAGAAKGTLISLPVHVLVDEGGEVIGAKFDGAWKGSAPAEDAAYRTLRKTRFVPGRLGNENVVSWTTLTVLVTNKGPFRQHSGELAQLAAADAPR